MDSEPEYRRYNSHSDRRRWAASYARHKYKTNTEYRAKSQLRYWRRKYAGNADFERIMEQSRRESAATFGASASTWTCSVCTYSDNPDSATECTLCGSER